MSIENKISSTKHAISGLAQNSILFVNDFYILGLA